MLAPTQERRDRPGRPSVSWRYKCAVQQRIKNKGNRSGGRGGDSGRWFTRCKGGSGEGAATSPVKKDPKKSSVGAERVHANRKPRGGGGKKKRLKRNGGEPQQNQQIESGRAEIKW